MAGLPARRQPGLFPDLLDWLDAPLLPFTAAHTFRVEDYVEDNRDTSAPNCLAWTRTRMSRSRWRMGR